MSGLEDNYRDFKHCPMCSGDTHVIGMGIIETVPDDSIIDMPVKTRIKLIRCDKCKSTWMR